MKIILKIIFFIIIILIISGYFIENTTDLNGKIYIGIGVLSFAFIFMPLFIYYRYKDRLGDFIDSRMEQPKEENRDLEKFT